MTLRFDRRVGNTTKDFVPVKNEGYGAASQFAKPATIQERRLMKKVARPEHAYTGCLPYAPDDDDSDTMPKKRNQPILGYRGHLRRDEDCIGTTFTQGWAIASRTAEPVSSVDTKARQRQVGLEDDKDRQAKPTSAKQISPRSGYGKFDNASGYGAFAAPSKVGMSLRSGYGEFDNASGYGNLAAPPAPGGISPRSRYDAFEDASGYGAFAPPPSQRKTGMSPRSGYGAFDNASGYGNFAAPPHPEMSPRSGYGAFDNASGYGIFASPPEDNAENARRGAESFHASRQQSCSISSDGHRDRMQAPQNSVLQAQYQQAIYRVGGEQAALRLWNQAADTISQRFFMRTELLQAVKRSFEKHERTNQGFVTKAQLKETLRDLSCVFTDDQVTALFATHDTQCAGTVSMSELLIALTKGI